jgi:hypothetical protein
VLIPVRRAQLRRHADPTPFVLAIHHHSSPLCSAYPKVTALRLKSGGLWRQSELQMELRSLIVIALAATALLTIPATVEAVQAPSDVVAMATRVTEPPRIDGALSEESWKDITPITDFKQREPHERAEPSERTEVRIAYDEAFLYLGLTMFDSEPRKIRRSILEREGRNDQDDHIKIGLDTYHDHRNAYIFEVNSYGTQDEAIVTDEGPPNWAFQSVFWSEGRLTGFGWTLEIAIPFSSLRYSEADEPTMGIVFMRAIRRKNEEVYWPLIGNDYRSNIAQVSRYATLTGLRGLQRSRKLQIKPYALLGGQKPGRYGETEVVRDIGFDARYAVTAQSTLDLTVNTDFAHVEVDDIQVNLTRFSLFFPEKRDFFLEWDGLFRFGVPTVNQGGGAGRTQLEAATYYSRRIGLNQPIAGGARYGGKNGPFWIGLMDIQTRDEGALPGSNYSVVRVRADVASGATVGTIFTNVQGGGLFNRAAGGDVNLRFLRSSALNAWATKVWDTQNLSSTAAGSLNLVMRNDKFSAEGDYLNVGRNFDPAVGFVRRRDMIRYKTDIGYYPRLGEGDSLIRQVRLNAGGFYIEGQDHVKQSSNAYVKGLVRFETGDELGVDVLTDFDRVARPFQVAGVEIPTGDYRFSSTKVYTRTNSSRRLYAEVNAGGGRFYGGDYAFYGGLIGYKFAPQLTTILRLDRNEFDLPLSGGNFGTTLVSLNVFAATGRKLYSNSLIQYDSVSRDFTANIRLRLLYRPGSDLYLVFNTVHRLDHQFDPRPLEFDRRSAVTKLTYMLAF